MDLHVIGPTASRAERAAVDSVLGEPVSAWFGGQRDIEREAHTALTGGRLARSQRDLLLPVLLAVQARLGWVSQGALNYISRRLSVPPAEAFAVASFYHLLSIERRAPVVAHVCDDIACRTRG